MPTTSSHRLAIEGDTITFSSGRTAYANNGIVGIAPDLSLYTGYDGKIYWPPSQWHLTEECTT